MSCAHFPVIDLAQVTGPDGTAALIDQLRTDRIIVSYDPQDRTLRAGDHDVPSACLGTRSEAL
jgi:hypothetical protein